MPFSRPPLSRRRPSALRSVLTVALLVLALAPGAVANAAEPAADCDATTAPNDVNGDGYSDLVAGDPAGPAGADAGAGQIVLRYGSSAGVGGGAQLNLRQDQAVAGLTALPGDRFGASLAVGLVDSDHCADVVIGSPGDTVDGKAGAGSVQVVFGSTAGLGQGRPGISIDASAAGLGLTPTAGQGFGTVLAIDADHGSAQPGRLAVGTPALTDQGAAKAGGVAVFDFAVDGDGTPQAARLVTQTNPGVPGASEPGDRFGAAVAFGWALDACKSNWCKELIVGVPGENSGAGSVVVLDATSTPGAYTGLVLSQNAAGVPGTAEPGDGFGTAISWARDPNSGYRFLAVGTPGEDIGKAKDAGSVTVFGYGTSLAKKRMVEGISQHAKGVSGTAEGGDRFGASVLVTPYHTDEARMALVVGVPGEDVGEHKDAGSVTFVDLYASSPGAGDVGLTQGSTGIPGAVEADEAFGSALGSTGAWGGSLLIAIPRDAGYSGGVVLAVRWTMVTGASQHAVMAWHPSGTVAFGSPLVGLSG